MKFGPYRSKGAHRWSSLLAAMLVLNIFSTVAPPNAAVAQEKPTLMYFALGDSYASGHGLAGESGACRRSSLAYPYEVEKALSETYRVEFPPENHLACSGAVARDRSDSTGEWPISIGTQIERVDKALDEREADGNTDPVLVTITIGANDMGISPENPEALTQVMKPQTYSPEFFGWLNSKTSALTANLTPGINLLLAHDNVYIVLTDYPNPFRKNGFDGFPCVTFFGALSCDQRMEHLILSLSATIGSQVSRVNDRGHLHLAFLGSRFESHYSDCAPFAYSPNAAETWFQGAIRATGDLKADLIANMDQCFHPNAAGHRAIASAVVERARTMLPTPVAAQPTEAPPEALTPAPSSGGSTFHLPWEMGSIWRITADNNAGHHADEWNRYAFDAVPDPGRSTPNVTAIADGTVLGFQADVPNSALFSQGHAGNCMMIRHSDGSVSLYAHLAEGSIPGELRHEGASVRSGMVIGVVGDTGFAAGVHLHWSLLSEGRMYDSEGYRTCYGPSVPSRYADNDAELIEDGGVPRAGRYYASTNDPAVATQPPPAPQPSCDDAGIPQITDGLSYSPETPDTATEVTFSFTITNISDCGTFQPEVLAIGGRDPNGGITDPLQIRDFALGPGESRTITQPAILGIPGTHEFFMVFLRAGGGWNEIPDTSGTSRHIYINVTEAGTGQEEATSPPIQQIEPDDTQDAAVAEPTSEAPQNADLEPMNIIPVGPDGSVLGVGFTVTTEDGSFLGACTVPVDFPDGYIPNCSVDVPLNTIVAVWFDPSSSTTNLTPVENPVYFDTSSVQDAQMWGPGFEFASTEASGVDTPEIVVDPPVGSGAVDIALITRDPGDGHLLTDVCYVVGQSNEGCDRNGDGQVTFEAIPYGTYTVRQTQTPAGYPAVNDYTINVQPTGYMEGPSFGTPLGFIVRQAPEQNAPNTRNVSVVFLDMVTHERVTTGVCVELIGASNVGCDRDLIDGQVDFLAVPAGGPYELSFSNLPTGAQVGESGGPLAVRVDASAGSPANEFVFVLLAMPGSGSGSGGSQEATDQGADNQIISPQDDAQGSESENGTQPVAPQNDAQSSGSATLLITFRGCPEGFNPNTGDFFAQCSVPLDAPDASFLYHGGDGQGGLHIAWLDRQYNGAYIFNAGSGTMNLELSGMAPVVRDGYQVVGADGVSGDTYVINLTNGETREVFVFYYFNP